MPGHAELQLKLPEQALLWAAAIALRAIVGTTPGEYHSGTITYADGGSVSRLFS